MDAIDGSHLVAESLYTNIHTYLGTGSSNLRAPDLSAEGAKGKGGQFQIDHLKCPSCVNPGSPMPSFKDLGEDNLHKLATFLEPSKGPKQREHLPRDNRRLRSAVRGAAARGAGR